MNYEYLKFVLSRGRVGKFVRTGEEVAFHLNAQSLSIQEVLNLNKYNLHCDSVVPHTKRTISDCRYSF